MFRDMCAHYLFHRRFAQIPRLFQTFRLMFALISCPYVYWALTASYVCHFPMVNAVSAHMDSYGRQVCVFEHQFQRPNACSSTHRRAPCHDQADPATAGACAARSFAQM